MRQKPRNTKENIINEFLLLKMVQVVPLMVLATLTIFLWQFFVENSGLLKAQTFAFVTIIFFELFHVFNARSFHRSAFNKSFFSNPLLILGVGLSVLFTVLVITVPLLQDVFGTVPLTFNEWLIILAVSSSALWLVEFQKKVMRAELMEHKNHAVSGSEEDY